MAQKERVGRVTIEQYRNSLRLRWTFHSKTYSLTVGRDSPEAIKAARAKAQHIDSDITFDRFDSSLVTYGKTTYPEVVSEIQPPKLIELRELWEQFLDDKLIHVKAKTQEEYCNFSRLLDKLDAQLTYDALQTKRALLAITTTDQTRRILQYLSACCDWGIKRRLITENPYKGLAAEMSKRSSVDAPDPNAFSEQERDAAIEAFRNNQRYGMSYRHYASIVKFWFLTGCRPSEAIGLPWKNVLEDCSSVVFSGSIQTIRGVQVRSEGSKNNKSRKLTVSPKVQDLLLSIKPSVVKPDDLVFPSPQGKAINYPNFISKIWGKIVDPIKPDTTPYNCRDTFITHQLLKGVPSAIITKWCDTSSSMIDKNYADKLKLSLIRPLD